MKIFLQLNLDRPTLPTDYRPVFVSLIKKCLSNCKSSLFDEYYSKQNPKAKAMTFAVKFNRPIFEKESISLGRTSVLMTVSCASQRDGIMLYNAFVKSRGIELPLAQANALKLLSVRVLQDRQIEDRVVLIKFLSPLVVRVHSRDNSDSYLKVPDSGAKTDEFQTYLHEVISNQISVLGKADEVTVDFSLEPVKAQTTVVKSFGCMIPASFGIFKLTARPELINFLYQAGMGSRRSEGFGMFEIIG